MLGQHDLDMELKEVKKIKVASGPQDISNEKKIKDSEHEN